MNKAIAIIPARYASTRLPGKPLLDVAGKPLLLRVWEAVCHSRSLYRIVIATDDYKISELCSQIGAECVITPSDLPSGTDRINYACRKLEEDADLILNIQGDEPCITGELIDNIITSAFVNDADVTTVVTRITSLEELFDSSVVKVVLREDGSAMYFSRSVVPHLRGVPHEKLLENHIFWRHIGIYAYKRSALHLFSTLEPSALEEAEKLEQLRLMDVGAKYHCIETDLKLIGVDTPEDLSKARLFFSRN